MSKNSGGSGAGQEGGAKTFTLREAREVRVLRYAWGGGRSKCLINW